VPGSVPVRLDLSRRAFRIATIGPRARALARALFNGPVSFSEDAIRRRTCALARKLVALRR